MLHLLARYWWVLALRGVLAVLFGLFAFFIPAITLLSLVLLFGAYVLLDGIFDLVAAVRSPSHHWALVLEGIVGMIAGILTFLWPGITAMVLLYLIAFWKCLLGVIGEIFGLSFENRKKTFGPGLALTCTELPLREAAWSEERSMATSSLPFWMSISWVGAWMLRITTVLKKGLVPK